MAEYSANTVQELAPGASAVFTTTVVPCDLGLIQHADGTPFFSLSGLNMPYRRYCPCQNRHAEYYVQFGANIALATGSTVGEISVAIAIDGIADPGSTMRVTPAAVEEYFNVSRGKTIAIFNNCCQTVTVTNTSDQTILMQEANLILRLTRPDPETL